MHICMIIVVYLSLSYSVIADFTGTSEQQLSSALYIVYDRLQMDEDQLQAFVDRHSSDPAILHLPVLRNWLQRYVMKCGI